jgi:hypothetical protein
MWVVSLLHFSTLPFGCGAIEPTFVQKCTIVAQDCRILLIFCQSYYTRVSIGCMHQDFWVCDTCNLAKWIQTPPHFVLSTNFVFVFLQPKKKRETTTKKERKKDPYFLSHIGS